MTAADVAEVVIIAAMVWFVWQCGYWWRGRNDRRDAERYRWLRAEHERIDPVCRLLWKSGSKRDAHEWVNTSAIDAAIDAAIAKATQP